MSKTDYIWQDREVRFDSPKDDLNLIKGEVTVDTLTNIEDIKGGNGDIGPMIFTNLRILWYCQTNIKINLSIGYDCILSSDIKTAESKLGGQMKALYLKSKFNGNRFEFVFNALGDFSPKMFTSFHQIYKAYDSTRLYRDLKMKGFLTQDKNIIVLQNETILQKVNNVHIVNNDQTVNGIFLSTNIRFVWYSSVIDNFNVSLPFIHIKSIKTKDSKAGKLLLVETNKFIGGNNFAFKFPDQLDTYCSDLNSIWKKSIDMPMFGVDLALQSLISEDIAKNKENLEKFKTALESDDVEIIETNYFNEHSTMWTYMTNNQDKKNNLTDIEYCPELGKLSIKI